jgi:3-isopropylmalate/(R)-2-methylmalate dehydratase large subunit
MDAEPGPMTLFEKIVARHLLQTPATSARPRPGEGAFVHTDWRFIHEYYTGMAAHALASIFPAGYSIVDAPSIVVFEDHTSYIDESPAHLRLGLVPNVRAMQQAQRDFVAQHGLRFHRTLTDDEARADDGGNVAGISHAMMAEHYALPGQLIVGTDSHTPHSGSLGCVAFGVGTTDMANALVTGAVRMTMPQSVRIELNGPTPAGLSAKDIVLHLLALPYIREGKGVGKVFEFAGSAVSAMSIDERATLTNMTAELGGLTGIVAPDEETARFLAARRGVRLDIAPWMRSDDDATFAHTIAVDCSSLSPMVAAPGDPGNGVPIDTLAPRSRSTSPTAARARQASATTSTGTTKCLPGGSNTACVSRAASGCTFNTGRPRFATIAWRAATTRRSRRRERASCSRRAAPARTAVRDRPPRSRR